MAYIGCNRMRGAFIYYLKAFLITQSLIIPTIVWWKYWKVIPLNWKSWLYRYFTTDIRRTVAAVLAKLYRSVFKLIRDTFSFGSAFASDGKRDFVNRWHFAIVMTGKGKRFYTRSSCRVIIKSGIILQFTAFIELINVSSRSPRRELVSTSLALSCLSFFQLQWCRRVNSKLEIKNSSRVDYYRSAGSRPVQK